MGGKLSGVVGRESTDGDVAAEEGGRGLDAARLVPTCGGVQGAAALEAMFLWYKERTAYSTVHESAC